MTEELDGIPISTVESPDMPGSTATAPPIKDYEPTVVVNGVHTSGPHPDTYRRGGVSGSTNPNERQ